MKFPHVIWNILIHIFNTVNVFFKWQSFFIIFFVVSSSTFEIIKTSKQKTSDSIKSSQLTPPSCKLNMSSFKWFLYFIGKQLENVGAQGREFLKHRWLGRNFIRKLHFAYSTAWEWNSSVKCCAYIKVFTYMYIYLYIVHPHIAYSFQGIRILENYAFIHFAVNKHFDAIQSSDNF
jgi:hypothetical protein